MGFVFNSCTSGDLLVQQRNGWSSANGRLRREDCEFVRHDKLFSKWKGLVQTAEIAATASNSIENVISSCFPGSVNNSKILVGPSDWNEHLAGKDGVERYHLHNLPATHFGPGVYELGVTAPSWLSGPQSQRPRTVRRQDVIAVYVGQADDIRQRLQKYGQAGAHLESSRSSKLYVGHDEVSCSCAQSLQTQNGGRDDSFVDDGSRRINKGPRLFSEVFALGSSIAFRWAQTDSKVVAEQVESELLAVFDYAWNKGGNGSRRSRDILAKLFMAWPTSRDALCCKRGLLCGANAVGINVPVRKPQERFSKSTKSKMGNFYFLMTVPPQRLGHAHTERSKVTKLGFVELKCGVLSDRGQPCEAPPVKGRKRCLLHKGMRLRRGPAENPLLSVIQRTSLAPDNINMRKETVKISGELGCLPKSFLGRQFLMKSKKECHRAPNGDGEGRRLRSLSFNSWMMMDSERVHDDSEPTWRVYR